MRVEEGYGRVAICIRHVILLHKRRLTRTRSFYLSRFLFLHNTMIQTTKGSRNMCLEMKDEETNQIYRFLQSKQHCLSPCRKYMRDRNVATVRNYHQDLSKANMLDIWSELAIELLKEGNTYSGSSSSWEKKYSKHILKTPQNKVKKVNVATITSITRV